MTDYTADVLWERGDQDFLDRRYSRAHRLRFDGGVDVPGSASPHVVPLPYADPRAVDPEEAFVAALASCHMLWFLHLACDRGYRVDRYADHAVGRMTPDADGKLWMSEVTLRPEVRFAGPRQPDADTLADLHHAAHAECFIARSVRSDVRVAPVIVPG